MKLYAGIDLHATNNYLGVSDEEDKRIFGTTLSNDLDIILLCLDQYKKDLAGVVVESAFNWYW
jgi:transposase